MENRKTFTYNGVNSADYGLYISGDYVYNAPSRVYEMVDIAGRNGQLAIDQGRFENIEVTYPAFIFAETQTEFAQRLRDIRAWLMSPVGYQRLEDTYHPDEYRMAIYKSGLEADPTHYNEAGEFELTFDCKPQRFLKSGEEEIDPSEWGETETITGNIVTFEGTDTTAIKSVVAQIEPKQEGSGDPSPDNVRPISGWDEVEVVRTGVNVWDEIWELGTILPTNGQNYSATTKIRSKNLIPVLPNTSYRLVALATTEEDDRIYYYDADKNYITFKFIHHGTSISETFTTPSNCRYVRFTTQGTTYNHDISINYPSTDHEYHPYHGQSHSISFPSTVYGGEVDVVGGNGKQTWALVDISTLFWDTAGDRFITLSLQNLCVRTPDWTPSDPLPKCTKYKYQAVRNGETTDNIFGIYNGYLYVRDSSYNGDVNAFRNGSQGVMVAYPLATPTDFTTTPEQIQTLLGLNNIWADSGEVSVEIGEDPNILVNPTPFEALPLFEVVGTGSLTVGNTTIGITGDSTQDIFIDSDIMEAYEDDNGAIISRNDRINLSGTDFPKLGEETRVESNGLTSVKITPRWWTI